MIIIISTKRKLENNYPKQRCTRQETVYDWFVLLLASDDELPANGHNVVVVVAFLSVAISTHGGVKFFGALSPNGLLSFVLRK